MQSEFTLTVQFVVNHPLFKKAQVVAGGNGLHRRIRWVHILEVADFAALNHGEEMILSTGIGMQRDITKTGFLEMLIQKGASCLCIELGSYLETIPHEMIELADLHHFPLIVFHEIVRFVDITQQLHSLIINRHHKMLEDLESVSRELNRLTLTSQGTVSILKLLFESTRSQIIFIPDQGVCSFIPAVEAAKQDELETYIRTRLAESKDQHKVDASFDWKRDDHFFLAQPVGVIGQIWAYVVMIVHNREPEEFDLLVLDRAAISVSQDLLRKRYIEERRLHSENLWVDDLIHSRLKNEEEIKSLIQLRLKNEKNVKCRVCLIEILNMNSSDLLGSETDFDAFRLHVALLSRTLFEKHSFRPFIMTKNNQLVIVMVDLNPGKSSKERLNRIFHSIQTAIQGEKAGKVQLRFGVGRLYSQFTDAHLSYSEAQQVLEVNRVHPENTDCFYEDIGAYRLLLHVDSTNTINSFIDDYIGPLIEQDHAKGSELLRTLKVYLDHDGSKQLSAQKLFVVRQTLYHRLDKIKELLGEDFMLPEKRLSIEIAIRAYQYVHRVNLG